MGVAVCPLILVLFERMNSIKTQVKWRLISQSISGVGKAEQSTPRKEWGELP